MSYLPLCIPFLLIISALCHIIKLELNIMDKRMGVIKYRKQKTNPRYDKF